MLAEAAVFIATAYSWGCGAGELTRTQHPPVPFYTVAVDPTIIPLGVALEIEAPYLNSPGRLWRAEDTGPDIVGNRIDIMVATCEQAAWWGRREVVLRIRKDKGWEGRLSKPVAVLAERLVSIRGSVNLRRRLSSVSLAEAQAASRSRISRLRGESERTGYVRFVSLADHSSLLEWAEQVAR